MKPLFLFCLTLLSVSAMRAAESARDRVQAAMRAMGGEQTLRDIKHLQFHATGHSNALEQSGGPDGYWMMLDEDVVEIRDLELKKSVITSSRNTWGSKQPVKSMRWTEGDQAFGFGMSPDDVITLAPERILFTALEASDLKLGPDLPLQQVMHRTVEFTYHSAPIRILFHPYTHLPEAVESVRTFESDVYWRLWGDVTTRRVFSFWMVQPGGLVYPLQTDVVRKDRPERSFTIRDLRLNDTDPLPQTRANPPSPRKVDETPLGVAAQPAHEVAPGVTLFPNGWNVAMVEQSDGIVVIESPYASSYSAKVIEEAERRYPGKHIKALISTSNSWPHFGGLREYTGRGIPAYIEASSKSVVNELLAAPYRTFPDSLTKSHVKPKILPVSAKTIVGSGPNRMELYPVGGDGMMMIYFPEHHLLYCSDLIQSTIPIYEMELIEGVAREKLEVTDVFSIHSDKRPWSYITNIAAKGAAPKPDKSN